MPEEAHFSETQPTHPATGRHPVWLETDNRGNLKVTLNGTGASAAIDTELPTAAALSDTIGNPTTPMVGGALMAWNGTTWERVEISNDRLLVAPKYNHTYVAPGQATTVIKASAGVLHTVTFWAAATATNVTTIYDHASGVGTIIGLPAATTATIPITITLDIAFTVGLTVITATANGSPMTFSWL